MASSLRSDSLLFNDSKISLLWEKFCLFVDILFLFLELFDFVVNSEDSHSGLIGPQTVKVL